MRSRLARHWSICAASAASSSVASSIACSANCAHIVAGFTSRWRNRDIRWVGVALGGRVHDGGVVDHPRLGWSEAPVGRIFSETLGYPVSVASHVEAMAPRVEVEGFVVPRFGEP